MNPQFNCHGCGDKATSICKKCGTYMLCKDEKCNDATQHLHKAICHDLTNKDPVYVGKQLEEAILDMQLCDVEKRYDSEDIDDAIDVLMDLDDHQDLNDDELHHAINEAHAIISEHLYDHVSQNVFAKMDKSDQDLLIGAEHQGDYQLYHMTNVAFDRIAAIKNDQEARDRQSRKDLLRAEKYRRRAERGRMRKEKAQDRIRKRAERRRRRAEKQRARALARQRKLERKARKRRQQAEEAIRLGQTKVKRGESRAQRSERGAQRLDKYGDFRGRAGEYFAKGNDRRALKYEDKARQRLTRKEEDEIILDEDIMSRINGPLFNDSDSDSYQSEDSDDSFY